jgi:serine/threonine protein kinase
MSEERRLPQRRQGNALPERSRHSLPELLERGPFPLQNEKYANYSDFQLVGQGSFGITRKAKNKDGNHVLIKELNFKVVDGMSEAECLQAFDSFEKEAKTLSQLSHPCIPRYIDSFARETEGEIRFYIVTEYVEGRNLEQFLGENKNFTEVEAKHLMRQVLEVLTYLQGFSPPILHRDIKPDNILIDDEWKCWLVDFGCVALRQLTTQKGTLCGTAGYAAPEQMLLGKASTSSEVYGLGASIVRILSRKDAAELLYGRQQINLREHLNVSDGFVSILEKMVSHEADDRFGNASEVLAAMSELKDYEQVTHSTSIAVVQDAVDRHRADHREYVKALKRRAREISKTVKKVRNLAKKGELPEELRFQKGEMEMVVHKNGDITIGERIEVPSRRSMVMSAVFLGY